MSRRAGRAALWILIRQAVAGYTRGASRTSQHITLEFREDGRRVSGWEASGRVAHDDTKVQGGPNTRGLPPRMDSATRPSMPSEDVYTPTVHKGALQ